MSLNGMRFGGNYSPRDPNDRYFFITIGTVVFIGVVMWLIYAYH